MNELQKEYIKWYRLAQEYVNDKNLFPSLTDTEILKNISRNNWLMFANAYQQEKKHAINLPEPNIYLSIEKDKLWVGIAFNNLAAVEKLTNILSDKSSAERNELIKMLLKLNNNYITIVERRIRKYYGPRPEFITETEIQTNKLNETEFQKIIKTCIKIREEGKEHKKLASHESFFECPAINLIAINIDKDVDKLKSVLSDIVPIYKICLDIKSTRDIEEGDLSEKIKQIESWEWALEEDRSWLAEQLKEKFNVEVSTLKLKKYADKLFKKKN